jgi:multidrug efflux pump subunit AcrB
MARGRVNKAAIKDKKAKRLPRLSLFFFKRPRLTVFIWLALLVFGILSYTSFMGRQGFPPVEAPLSIVTGSYLVENPQKVDAFIDKPISEIALKQNNVKSVQSTANPNTFSIVIQYKDGTDPKTANKTLEAAVKASNKLPKTAKANFQVADVGRFSPRGEGFDMLIAVYGNGLTPQELTDKAAAFSKRLNNQSLSLVAGSKVIDPFSEGINPATGKAQQVQTSFDRFGERINGKIIFHDDVAIGLKAVEGADAVKLYNQVQPALDNLNLEPQFQGIKANVTAAFAPQINQEINELQRTLLEGLIAILIVGTILVSLRASLLILLSMATVIAITLGGLYLIGYTLNVITLFAIILGLALIVDDTIIMTEALDVERRRQKTVEDTVKVATNKVSLAMLAATSTAILGFAPLIFISGILGGFIRPIPLTLIISLVVSLLVALTVIPTLARPLILRARSIGPKVRVNFRVRAQESFANVLTAPLRWANHYRKRLWISGIVALIVGLGFIAAGAYIFKYLTFNIFPSNKDSNQLMVSLQFPAGTTIKTAQATADKVDTMVEQTLGSNLDKLNYYSTGDTSAAQLFIDLIPYNQREVTAPQLVDQLKTKFNGFSDASVSISQQDVGGPPGSFSVFIETTDRQSAMNLAGDMVIFLQGKTLERADGSTAHISKAMINNPDAYLRQDGKQLVQVTAEFDASDTSTLVTLAQNLVQKHYTNQELAKFNLKTSNIVFDFGFENENQKSFKSMLIAFPILLVVMFIVLALEFRSLLQPILIFMAIPFSFFGVTGGLWLTDNPFSFFTLLGFFALIGLSIKNTILLTDYANQARQAGLGRVEAIASAVEERFRPLLATSATAVFSLLPLALTSPFWESLAFTLIFGLLSSTLLVLLVFPYYYLGAEYLRMRISRRGFLKWLVINILIVGLTGYYLHKTAVLAFVVLNLLLVVYFKKFKKAPTKR